MGSLDGVYNSTFVTESWKELLERGETNELVNRIQRYLMQSNATVNLPIAEAMLTYKEKRYIRANIRGLQVLEYQVL